MGHFLQVIQGKIFGKSVKPADANGEGKGRESFKEPEKSLTTSVQSEKILDKDELELLELEKQYRQEQDEFYKRKEENEAKLDELRELRDLAEKRGDTEDADIIDDLLEEEMSNARYRRYGDEWFLAQTVQRLDAKREMVRIKRKLLKSDDKVS